MKVFKKVTISGEWVKIKEDIFDGDIIGIVSTGEKVMGKYGERYVFTIETKKGEEKNMTFNQTTMNHMIDAFGDDTDDWIGQSIKVWLVKSNVKGKMTDVAYLTAPDWVETKDGFAPPATSEVKDEDIPIIEDESTEEN